MHCRIELFGDQGAAWRRFRPRPSGVRCWGAGPSAGPAHLTAFANRVDLISCGPPPSAAPGVPDGIAASRPSRSAVD